MRKPFIAGNWKLHETVAEATALAEALRASLADVESIELGVAPTATALYAVSEALKGSNIQVSAQNMYWAASGAFTGEISPPMVKELATHVIIGHSERRAYFGETDETVNRKIKAAFAHNLTPIVCIGENLEQNKAGETVAFVSQQIHGAFAGIPAEEARKLTLAYEPIWAIGTGLTATPQDANRIIREAIRETLVELYDEETAEAIRVQYGAASNRKTSPTSSSCRKLMGHWSAGPASKLILSPPLSRTQ